MPSKAQSMLTQLYHAFNKEYPDSYKAWDNMLEFIALDFNPSIIRSLQPTPDWLNLDSDKLEAITKTYSPELLTEIQFDHIGEVYQIMFMTNEKLRTPNEIARILKSIRLTERKERYMMLDQEVGSGRLLLAAHTLKPDGVYFGVDHDLRLLRIAMTNFSIFKIPGYLLHADPNKHEVDITTPAGKKNWDKANYWNSQISKLQEVTTKQIDLLH